MPDTYSKYEQRLIRNIIKNNAAIRAIYDQAVEELSAIASKYEYKGVIFDLNKYPVLKAKIEAKIREMHGSVYSVVVNGIKESWDLANEKNNVIVDKRLKGRTPTPRAKQILYDPNAGALKQFIARRKNGLDLSQRIWKGLDPFNIELEQGLGLGISKGQSAREMASDLKQYLKDPDKLFRKVRDKSGKLRLSQRAKNYHPGKGRYRSSFQNALRLTASETNIAYRSSDHERWKVSPIVKGIEVKLSDSHPKLDICDHLVGKYPKDYKHTGFHPRCLCYAVPILTSEKEFDKQLDVILGIADEEPEIKGVTKVPKKAIEFVRKNAKRFGKYKSMPYFIADNPQYYAKFFD